MKLTRRELAAALVSVTAAAQTTNPPAGATEELQAARDRLKTNSETLARLEVSMGTEPAFQFKV